MGTEGSLPGYPLRGGQAPTQSPQPPPCPCPRHPCAPFTDLAATPPGKSICKGGQSGGAPSLQGPLLSPLVRPTPVGNGVVPSLTPTLTSATYLPPLVMAPSAVQLSPQGGEPLVALTRLCSPTVTPTSEGATLAGSARIVSSPPLMGTFPRPALWSGTVWEVRGWAWQPALGPGCLPQGRD